MRFKIDWASLIVGILLCFTLYLRAIFQVQAPVGHILRGDLTAGFLHYRFGGLIFGGAKTWRGLFSEFYAISGRTNLHRLFKYRFRFLCYCRPDQLTNIATVLEFWYI